MTLVDTDGEGVEAFTEKGVVANDQEFEVDCIVFATGFEVGTDYSRRAGYSISGIDGLTISDKWADGMATFTASIVAVPVRFLWSSAVGFYRDLHVRARRKRDADAISWESSRSVVRYGLMLQRKQRPPDQHH